MGERREKFVLQPIQLFGLAEESRVLDRRRHAARELFDEHHIAVGILPARLLLGGPERHDADDASAHDQRRADVRVRAQLLPELHQGGVDMVRKGRGRLAELLRGHDERRASLHDALCERRHRRRSGRFERAQREIADERLLLAHDVSPGDMTQRAMVILDDDVAVVAEAGQRQVHSAIERLAVIERGAEQQAHIGEKRQPVARRNCLTARLPLSIEQFLERPLRDHPLRDVARDRRSADDRAGFIANR